MSVLLARHAQVKVVTDSAVVPGLDRLRSGVTVVNVHVLKENQKFFNFLNWDVNPVTF